MKINSKKFILALSLIFVLSLFLKWEYVGTLSDGHHQFGTALTKLAVENWINDGIAENNFIRALIPKSIDYENFKDRGLYVSYPIGTDFIVYLFKLIFKNSETLKIIHLLSAFFHYLSAIFIFLFVFKVDFNLEPKIKANFALIAAVSYVFFPLPFYYHLMLFSFDQSIILPFIIILFLEFLIRHKRNNNNYLLYQSIVFLLAGFLDYFSIVLGSSIFLFRILLPIKNINILKNFVQIIIPTSLPILTHLIILYENGMHLDLFNRFTRRTGMDYLNKVDPPIKGYNSFIYHFWIKKFHIYLPLIIFVIFFLLKNLYKSNFRNNSFLVLLIGFFSCILYSLVLSDWAAIHDFSTLKFYPILSIGLFGLIPLKLIEKFKNKEKIALEKKNNFFFKTKFTYKLKYLAIIFLVLIVLMDNSIRLIYYSKINQTNNYIFYQNKFYKSLIFSQFPYPNLQDEIILNKINNLKEFNDVFISLTDFEVKLFPPQRLSISKKIVNKITTRSELIEKINKISKSANIKLIIDVSNNCNNYFENDKKIFVSKLIIINLMTKDEERIIKCL